MKTRSFALLLAFICALEVPQGVRAQETQAQCTKDYTDAMKACQKLYNTLAGGGVAYAQAAESQFEACQGRAMAAWNSCIATAQPPPPDGNYMDNPPPIDWN